VPKILAITNQKGGVGKTTTGVNLAASLAAAQRRVLLVDLDPQGNATMGSGVDKRNLKATVYHVLLGAKRIAEVTVRSENGGYDVVIKPFQAGELKRVIASAHAFWKSRLPRG